MSFDLPFFVRLPVGQWSIVDAALDHAISDAGLTADEQSAEMARAIREAGWEQIPRVDGQMPPLDEVVPISLLRSQWFFALGEIESTIAMCDELGLVDLADRGREVVGEVESQLTLVPARSYPVFDDPLLATPLARAQAVAMDSRVEVRDVAAPTAEGLTALVRPTRDERGSVAGGSLTFLRSDLDDSTRTELLAFALGLLAVRGAEFRRAPGEVLGIGGKLPLANDQTESVAGMVLERVGHPTTAVNYAVGPPPAEMLALLD